MPLVAGIDSSTQACTIVLRDADDGRIVASAEAPHPAAVPPISEQQPEAWWEALQAAAHQLDLTDVVALSVDGQGHGLVVLDATGRPIRPAKLWNDTTTATEARELVDQLGPAEWARRTGIVPISAITISKLLWFKRHDPDGFERLDKVLLPPDYLTYCLTGAWVTDRSAGSGSGYMDVTSSAWDLDVLGLVDAECDWSSMLPHVAGPTEAAGRVSRAAARATGFPEEPWLALAPTTSPSVCWRWDSSATTSSSRWARRARSAPGAWFLSSTPAAPSSVGRRGRRLSPSRLHAERDQGQRRVRAAPWS